MSKFRKGLVALSILSILLPSAPAFAETNGIMSLSERIAGNQDTVAPTPVASTPAPTTPSPPAPVVTPTPARVAVASAPPPPPAPPAQAWVNPPLPRGLVLARGDHWACQGRSQQIRCGVMTQNNTRWRSDVPFYWYTYDGAYVGSNPAQVGIQQTVYAPEVQPAAYVQPAPPPQPPAPQGPTFDQQMQLAQWQASPNTPEQQRGRDSGLTMTRRVGCERTQGRDGYQCTNEERIPSTGERIATGVGVAAVLGTILYFGTRGNRCYQCR